MKKIVYALLIIACLSAGCSTMDRKQKLLEKGTFAEKVDYLDKNFSGKSEVVEFFGPPDAKQDFFNYCSIWKYYKTEKPLEIMFGRDGTILRININENLGY